MGAVVGLGNCSDGEATGEMTLDGGVGAGTEAMMACCCGCVIGGAVGLFNKAEGATSGPDVAIEEVDCVC